MAQIHALTDLETLEVSLVGRGANRKKFALAKSENSMEVEDLELLKAVVEETELENESEIDAVLKQAEVSERAMTQVKAALRMLMSVRGEMPDAIMQQLAGMAGYGLPPTEKQEEDKKDEEYEMPVAKDGTPDLRSVPQELRTSIEALWKDRENAVKKQEELEATLKAERDIRLSREFEERASKEFQCLGSSKDVGSLLKALNASDPELADRYESVLKAANARIEQSSLFEELGTSGRASSGNTAWDRIEKAAKQIIEKSNDVEMSHAKAVTLVMQLQPNLYQDYLAEQGAQ